MGEISPLVREQIPSGPFNIDFSTHRSFGDCVTCVFRRACRLAISVNHNLLVSLLLLQAKKNLM